MNHVYILRYLWEVERLSERILFYGFQQKSLQLKQGQFLTEVNVILNFRDRALMRYKLPTSFLPHEAFTEHVNELNRVVMKWNAR